MDLAFDQYKVGDILTVVGELEELTIEKVWLSKQGSYAWVDYDTRTQTSGRRLTVSVEYDDGEWEVVLYDRYPSADELPEAAALPAQLTYEGQSFRRLEQGKCRMRLVSALGEELSCSYADYSGSSGAVLSVELFQDPLAQENPPEVEIYVGREVRPDHLRLYAPVDLEERIGLIMHQRTRLGRGSSSQQGLPVSRPVAVAIGLVLLLIVVLALAL